VTERRELLDLAQRLDARWPRVEGATTRGLMREAANALHTLARGQSLLEELTQALELLRRERNGEVWCWQGDDEDHPESLTCPVLMSAEHVRAFVADRARLAALLDTLTASRCTCGPAEFAHEEHESTCPARVNETLPVVAIVNRGRVQIVKHED
jgi:hypothetical protein